jgi:hypothetical protein
MEVYSGSNPSDIVGILINSVLCVKCTEFPKYIQSRPLPLNSNTIFNAKIIGSCLYSILAISIVSLQTLNMLRHICGLKIK